MLFILDSWRRYNELLGFGYRSFRVYRSRGEFAKGGPYINGIESFWDAKNRLVKFKGVDKSMFNLNPIVVSKIFLVIFRKESFKLS